MNIAPAGFDVQLSAVLQRDEEDFIWFHPRAAPLPAPEAGGTPRVVLTLQKHLQVSDYYSGLHVMWTDDLGATWSAPDAPAELDWWRDGGGGQASVADVTPGWHPQSGRCLAIGIKVRYDRQGAQLADVPHSRETAYTVYDPAADTWAPWQMVALPDPDGKFFVNGSGCAQWVAAPDGRVLVPIYFAPRGATQQAVTVLQCRFDGKTLAYVQHGDELRLDVERGLCEPSLVAHRGRYYLTLRNDQKAYATVSDDGLHFEPVRPWSFDDGTELGSYNTQQHWLARGDGLFLVYTRRGAQNDHVMRHRAPLFIAQVDPARLCVLRETERILIPEHGAPMGNFGATSITEGESWVTVSELMSPQWNDMARRRGAAGLTLLARVLWH